MKNLVTIKRLQASYTKREVLVPMRDGVRLYTAIYEPRDQEPHPVIMERTPYPLNPYGRTFSKDLRLRLDSFVEEGYIVVFQNVRGKFMSEGEFENIRPVSGGETPDECSDCWDTVEWILANCRTTGSVGVKGISYPGFYATMAGICAHPAIKAVSPQAPVTDWFMGDDSHLAGALQLPMLDFAASFFRPRGTTGKIWPKAAIPGPDTDVYDYYRERDIPALLSDFSAKLPFLKEMLFHPVYDDWWRSRNPALHLKDVKAAFLIVAGLFDGEDCYGSFETWRRLSELSPACSRHLAIGPWYHGAWKKKGYSSLGPADFGEGSAEFFLRNIEFPFFDYYLRGRGVRPPLVRLLPSAETMPGSASAHRWTALSDWPSADTEKKRYYFAPGLERDDDLVSAYISDPLRPVPFQADTSSWDRAAQVADQRFSERRPDVLSFRGPVLKEALQAEGPVHVSLRLRCSAGDADMVVKLVDQRPDGVRMLVRYGVQPLRFRRGFSHADPVVPGEVMQVDFSLNDIAHHFMPGHRLMLQLQSSLFPALAMNPQTLTGKGPAEAWIELMGDSYMELTLKSKTQ